MRVRSHFSRLVRAVTRSFVIGLAGVVLSAAVLPVSASAATTGSPAPLHVKIGHVVKPADGVGDSPIVP